MSVLRTSARSGKLRPSFGFIRTACSSSTSSSPYYSSNINIQSVCSNRYSTTSSTSSSSSSLSSLPRRLFSTSPRAALSENDGDHADLAEHNEKHKQEQLREQREGKGKWKGELSSNSEQAIKADRGDVEASNETISKMQQETAKAAEQEKSKGK